MTGSILPHKNLVTNYGLLSSVEDAARASKNNTRASDVPIRVIDVDESASIGLSLVPSIETMETIAVSPAAEYAAALPVAADNNDDHDRDNSSSS